MAPLIITNENPVNSFTLKLDNKDHEGMVRLTVESPKKDFYIDIIEAQSIIDHLKQQFNL